MDTNLRSTHPTLPLPARRALLKLGHDIRDARRKRRIPSAVAAARASVSRMTLLKVEKGDPGVAMGTYATVLFVLGLSERLADVADPAQDTTGLQLDEEHLPQRIRTRRTTTTKSD
jgi:DNA-binding XRE family transcriptional regulator